MRGRGNLARGAMVDALLRAERRYDALVRAMDLFVWVAGPDGRLVGDLPPWRAITGQRLDELLDFGWIDAVHPEDRERVRKAWCAATQSGSLYTDEYRVRGADGHARWLRVRGAPVLDEDGAVVEFTGLCVDVTERRTLAAALGLEREILERVVEQAPVGMALLWGPELRFRLHNNALLELIPPDRSLMGRPMAEVLPEAAPQIPVLLEARVLGGPARVIEDLAVPFADARAYAGHRYYDITLQPVPEAGGAPGGVLLTAVETTEAHRRRSALQAALEHERETTVALQRALIPNELPDLGVEVAVRYRPAGGDLLAGGDWFDVLDLGRRCVGLVVGDVAGHGVVAATVMGQLRAAVRAHLIDADASPAEVLRRVARFAETHERGEMATVACARIDLDRRKITFARAGHTPAVLVAPGRAPVLVWGEERSPPFGAPSPAFVDAVLGPLASGTTLLLFTDGLVERRGEPLDAGLDRLLLAMAGAEGRDLEALLDELLAGAPADDDVAALVVRLP